MQLPFSRQELLDEFAVYNSSWWLVALTLWILKAAVFAVGVSGRDASLLTFGLRGSIWAWAAVAYHAVLFSRINSAPSTCVVTFLIESPLFASSGALQDLFRI